MSADDSHDLLPCPFCGGSAEFVPYKSDGLTLKCTSLGCIQRNQRSLRYGIDSLRASMTKHWNSRAFASRQPVGLSPIATRKLEELAAQGYVTNGVAIFNPATGQRGLVDDLGYVGWQGAQGIDLGTEDRAMLLRCLRYCKGDAVDDGSGDEIDRLISLIDGRDAGTGVGNSPTCNESLQVATLSTITPPADLRTKLGEAS